MNLLAPYFQAFYCLSMSHRLGLAATVNRFGSKIVAIQKKCIKFQMQISKVSIARFTLIATLYRSPLGRV